MSPHHAQEVLEKSHERQSRLEETAEAAKSLATDAHKECAATRVLVGVSKREGLAEAKKEAEYIAGRAEGRVSLTGWRKEVPPVNIHVCVNVDCFVPGGLAFSHIQTCGLLKTSFACFPAWLGWASSRRDFSMRWRSHRGPEIALRNCSARSCNDSLSRSRGMSIGGYSG